MINDCDIEKFLKELLPLADEPEENILEFNFDEYAKQIQNIILNPKTPTPFTIGINGEWGSGKTSLMKRIYKNTKTQLSDGVIWFDASEYERIGVMPSLLQKIKKEVSGNKKIKNSIKFAGLIALDLTLQKHTGITFTDIQKRHAQIFNEVNTLSQNINKLLKNQKKLIIFVDDLDRCKTDNILDVLESIKHFLSIENIIFLIAADMSKIERAWTLKYNSKESHEEGREYIEKFFQLQLTLPLKSSSELKKYIMKLTKIYDDDYIDNLNKNLPSNPRRIKKILNSLHFILTNYQIDIDRSKYDYQQYFKILIGWILLYLYHPNITKIVRNSPSSLIHASEICLNASSLSDLKRDFETTENSKKSETTENLNFSNLSKPKNLTSFLELETYKIIKYVVIDNNDAYEILTRFLDIEDIYDDNKKSKTELLTYIINKIGLLG